MKCKTLSNEKLVEIIKAEKEKTSITIDSYHQLEKTMIDTKKLYSSIIWVQFIIIGVLLWIKYWY